MYPREELNLLERRKAILRSRIRRQRIDTNIHLQEVFRPVMWLSGLQAKWKGLPLGLRMFTGPLAFIVQSALLKRLPIRGKLLLWVPMIWKVAKWVIPFMKATSQARARTPSRAAIETVVKARREVSADLRAASVGDTQARR